MPHRVKKKKGDLATPIILTLLLLWMMGLRVHVKAINGLFAGQPQGYWRMELKDGSVYTGKKIFDTADAVTIEAETESKTAVKPEVVKLERLSSQELREMNEKGWIQSEESGSFLTWRKEDMLFYPLLSAKAPTEQERKNMTILKTSREGKMDQLDPYMVAKYKQELRKNHR